MDMYRDLNTKYDKMRDFAKNCERMAKETRALIEKRKQLIEFDGFSKLEQNRLLAKYNPEDYYSFRLFDKGVSIYYTNYWYDEETGRSQRHGESRYVIKYYNCKSVFFEQKEHKLHYCYENTSYGGWDSLDVAKSYFRKAVVDLLIQFGNCKALSPLDFM